MMKISTTESGQEYGENMEKALSEAGEYKEDFEERTKDGTTQDENGYVYDSNGEVIGIPFSEWRKNHPIDY